MVFNPEKQHRKSIRLKNHDYSEKGYYYITVCTQNRENLLCDIDNGHVVLNENGIIVKNTWFDLPNHNANIVLDEFTIMPNHIHAIIIIVGAGSKPAQSGSTQNHGAKTNRAGLEPAPTSSLSEIVRQLKTFSARQINKHRNKQRTPVWQRNYYEHIIRNAEELNKIRVYIANNPLNWQNDKNYRG